MDCLRFASCMAENSEFVCRAVAAYIHHQLGIPTECVTDIPWQERERLFDQAKIHVLWLCGLPYVNKADSLAENIELLAVPVPEGARYQKRPIYFSDVVVNSESRYRSFKELRGGAWAYNEPRSHSGYNVVRYHLALRGERCKFFGRVVESGNHHMSLTMVLDGRVDATAIDSTVLEWEIAQRPEIGRLTRVIESFGPSPIPPWVVTRRVPEAQTTALRGLLLEMHQNRTGRAILAKARISRFLPARDGDYDPIRRIAQIAEQASLS
jgi:phosphonate transport system substrate-binding protein